jgi:exopolysaccharide production protein ExoZ
MLPELPLAALSQAALQQSEPAATALADESEANPIGVGKALPAASSVGDVGGSRFSSVQVLRAFAACLAVSWHFRDVLMAHPELTLHLPRMLQLGYAGVDLFFVLSGFIICHVAFRGPFRLGSFARRRFIRIYPFYFFFTSLVVVAWLLDRNLTLGHGQPTAQSLWMSYAIFPQQDRPLLFVGWSLEHEIIFYFLVAVVGLTGRFRLIEPVLALLFVFGVLFREIFPNRWDYHLLSEYHFEFLVGTAIYFRQKALTRLGVIGPLIAGVALLLLTAQVTTGTQAMVPRVLGYGLAGGFLLISGLNGERLGSLLYRQATLNYANRGLVRLGDASYTLYLAHPFVLSGMSKIALALSLHGIALISWLCVALLAPIAFALLFYRWIEEPFLAFAHKRMATRRKTDISAVA